MKDLLRKTRYGMEMACALLVAVSVLMGAGSAWALPAIQFDVFFNPPAGSSFEGRTLEGTLSFKDSFFDVLTNPGLTHDSFFDVSSNPGPPGDSFFDVFYPPDPGSLQDSFFDVFFSFAGSVNGHPVYAFAPGTTGVDSAPASAPMIHSFFDVFQNPGPTQAPLFGFESPGTQVGLISVHPTDVPVPEPSTLLLLGAGLAGVVIIRRKFIA